MQWAMLLSISSPWGPRSGMPWLDDLDTACTLLLCCSMWSCHPCSMLKTTWQHQLVYWKSAFYVIKIPALTQSDSSSKSVSDVLCHFICLFFTLWSFICFNCVSHRLWSFRLVYLRYLFWAITLHSWGGKADNQALMEYFYALCGLQQTCFWHLEMEIYIQSIVASQFLITHRGFLAF